MAYKAICSDIDGTLLNKDRVLSERTIAAIKGVIAQPAAQDVILAQPLDQIIARQTVIDVAVSL